MSPIVDGCGHGRPLVVRGVACLPRESCNLIPQCRYLASQRVVRRGEVLG